MQSTISRITRFNWSTRVCAVSSGSTAGNLNGVEFFVLNNEILAFGDFIPPRDVLPGHHLARFGIHVLLLQSVAGLSIEPIEADFLAKRGGWVQGNWTRDQGQPKVALPIRARGHFDTPTYEAKEDMTQDLANALSLTL
jgi:hypothetical protein